MKQFMCALTVVVIGFVATGCAMQSREGNPYGGGYVQMSQPQRAPAITHVVVMPNPQAVCPGGYYSGNVIICPHVVVVHQPNPYHPGVVGTIVVQPGGGYRMGGQPYGHGQHSYGTPGYEAQNLVGGILGAAAMKAVECGINPHCGQPIVRNRYQAPPPPMGRRPY